jgi:hypothetical protein
MATICYAWDDAPFRWDEAPFTWIEGCVLEKLLRAGGPSWKVRNRLKELDDEERQIIIGLFVRLNVDEIVFEKRMNKHKNQNVKLKLKDVEIIQRQQKNIKVNVKIKE